MSESEKEQDLFCRTCGDKTTHTWDGEKWICEVCSDCVYDENEAELDQTTWDEEEEFC